VLKRIVDGARTCGGGTNIGGRLVVPRAGEAARRRADRSGVEAREGAVALERREACASAVDRCGATPTTIASRAGR